MPLIKSGSRAAISTNISEMVHAGHPQQQAIAAAMRTARKYSRKLADGGSALPAARQLLAERMRAQRGPNRDVDAAEQISAAVPRGTPFMSETEITPRPPFAGGGGINVGSLGARQLSHAGMIHSPVPGRTDRLPISVKGGAYILPADHVSAVGQGNSAAGANIINSMFKMGPFAGNPLGKMNANLRAARTNPPKLGRLGHARGGAAHDVPIVAAGGEFAIPPDKVAEIGGGDIDRGHKILDHWVLSTRKKHIKTLRGLKPPKK